MVIRDETIQRQERFHREMNYSEYTEALPLERLVDRSFQQRALAALGPYRN
jgi:hypothetical protein